MTDDLTALRNRQDTLEGRVAQLEVTVEREASLRATMDEDLSNSAETLKAHKALLQALHETQQEHTATLAEHTATLAEHSATLAAAHAPPWRTSKSVSTRSLTCSILTLRRRAGG